MNEKLVSDFMNLGCPTERAAAIALQVYLELCEVRKYFNVEYHFSKDLQCLYFTGKKTKSSNVLIFVPVAVSERLSFSQMQNYLTLSNLDQKSVVLVIVDSDSTCVYYEITDGIKDPLPETPQLDVEDKRAKLNAKLHKNSKLLEQSAMYGIPITLPLEVKNKVESEDSE